MFNLLKKFTKKETGKSPETPKQEIENIEDDSRTKEEISGDIEKNTKFEKAYHYIEDKIDNFNNKAISQEPNENICPEESEKQPEDKDSPKVKLKNGILYYPDEKDQEVGAKELNSKIPEQLSEEETKEVEEAYHYFEHVIEEHEKITQDDDTPVQEPAEQEQPPEVFEEEKDKGFFGISSARLKQVVSKTSEFFGSNIFSLSEGKQEMDDDLLDDMEEKLIRADIGVSTTVYIIEKLREKKHLIKPDALKQYLKEEFLRIIKDAGSNEINLKPGLNIFLITGVNGAGKTTLIGKLAYRYIQQGKKVLVAAGDTFRAAAEDQLEIWTTRAGAEIVRNDGADPASVVYDAVIKAKECNFDVLLIDTAGRLHNKFNLMEELRKIKKVMDGEAPDSLAESILVIDSTTGQNGMKQAEIFKEAVNITGVALTKLDGTAKGGVILGIAKELNLPVKLIGVGEQIRDLKDFNADDFIEALF